MYDNFRPLKKPEHRFSDHKTNSQLASSRASYDEYIGTTDAEFGRFMDYLDESGLRENSYVIVTSDHGEMFERGEREHDTPLMYEPVIRIPLMISAPGQQKRRDVFSNTSSVDVLPTLLNLVGKPVPEWCEGRLLPELGGQVNAQRATFAVEAKRNPAFTP